MDLKTVFVLLSIASILTFLSLKIGADISGKGERQVEYERKLSEYSALSAKTDSLINAILKNQAENDSLQNVLQRKIDAMKKQ